MLVIEGQPVAGSVRKASLEWTCGLCDHVNVDVFVQGGGSLDYIGKRDRLPGAPASK